MGPKSGNQWRKNFVYIACCLLSGFFLPGCFSTSIFKPETVTVDTRQEQFLDTVEKHIQDNDFKLAAKDNDQLLQYYENRFQAGDNVVANYIRQTKINQKLLARIISDQQRILTLSRKLQTRAQSQQEDKLRLEALMAQKGKLSEQVTKLEHEKRLLEEQILQLKQIDLNRVKAPGRESPNKAMKPR